MQTSFTDTINLGASVVSIIGAVATTAGFVRKLVTPAAPRTTSSVTPSSLPSSGFPPVGYPPSPTAGPSVPRPATSPVASPHRQRIPHPVILGLAAFGLLCVVGYSLVLLGQYLQTGSTNVPVGSPLLAVTGVLIVGNLLAGSGAVLGLLVTAARARAWGWVTIGVIGLVIMLVTIGIFSVVALVPAAFYALYVDGTPGSRS